MKIRALFLAVLFAGCAGSSRAPVSDAELVALAVLAQQKCGNE